MQIQKQLGREYCLDGRCPEGIDSVKEIGLSQLEKRAIFFSLQNAIERAKKDGARDGEVTQPF